MNDNTLVTIHGYAGDAGQIDMMMPYYKHHGCPVMVLSPEDSPITPRMLKNPGHNVGVEFRTAGKRAYIGQLSLDRQLEHLRVMLNDPRQFQWFLANDADSVVLKVDLPQYLYEEKDVMWSNIVSDAMHDHHRPPGYPWPHLAFQPPYFFSRHVLEKIVAVGPSVPGDPGTPFIDWVMMAWTVAAGMKYKSFPEGVSCPTIPDTEHLRNMVTLVETGDKYFLHAIKDPRAFHAIVYARIRRMDAVKKAAMG
jgi:hypothetical protein